MPGPVQSIERAAAVLRLLARHRSLGLVEISTALALAKGTTHGILATLKTVGLVDQDRGSGRYRPGEGLLHLSALAIDPNELRSQAANLSDALASRSGQATRIAVLTGGRVQVVHHVFRPDDGRQTLDVGTALPAHASALGKVLLAFDLADPVVTAAPMDRYTRRTLTDAAGLRRALLEVRERGWADEVEERIPGEAAVAAPLRAHGGLVVGAIGVSGPVDRVCDAQGRPRPALVDLVRDTAGAVSRELGDPR